MRPLAVALLFLAIPTNAAELCVVDAESICCHFMCDVYSPTPGGGYSTDGFPSCGWGEFTISSSDTDPSQNQGPLTGFPQLYLWVNADPGYGFSDGWGHLSGDLEVAIFSPLHPGVFWDPIEQRFDVAFCTYESTLLASLAVWEPPVSAGEGVESESWGRVKARHR